MKKKKKKYFTNFRVWICWYLTKMRYQEIRAFFIARKTIYHIKGGTINEQLQTVRQALPQAGLMQLKCCAWRGGEMDPDQPLDV